MRVMGRGAFCYPVVWMTVLLLIWLLMAPVIGLEPEAGHPEQDHVTCSTGDYYEPGVNGTPGICKPCVPGTFMDKVKHHEPWCYRCSTPDLVNPYYEVVDSCTRFHDVRKRCREGLYKDVTGRCRYCKHCEGLGLHVGRPCSSKFRRDAICCPKPEMVVIHGRCAPPPPPTSRSPPRQGHVSVGTNQRNRKKLMPKLSSSTNVEVAKQKDIQKESKEDEDQFLVFNAMMITLIAISSAVVFLVSLKRRFERGYKVVVDEE